MRLIQQKLLWSPTIHSCGQIAHAQHFAIANWQHIKRRQFKKGWQTNTKSFDEVWNDHQANRSNIGLVLANISGVMDIDCDSLEAVALMHHLADGYLGHFNRGHDSAHYLFLCEGGGKTVQLAHPEDGVMIELRGDGGQTMVPPSTHPDGQQLSMKDWHSDASHHQYDSLCQFVYRVGVWLCSCEAGMLAYAIN